jgi:RimJ/RimL family protein N-acetyltransferase
MSDLDTDRLTLRRHRLEDFEDCAAMWADPEVVRFLGGKPVAREDAWRKFMMAPGHWALMGFGYWVLRERATGRFVGEAGFGNFKREITPAFGGAPEAGWALASDLHRKGYATEAVTAILAWGDRKFLGARTVCLISPENLPSLRLAHALGFAEYARVTYQGAVAMLLERRGRA